VLLLDHRDALHLVLIEYKIVAKQLAIEAQMSESQLSKLRRKEVDLISANFFRLADALPPLARAHFYALMLQGVGREDDKEDEEV
jgi:hypothetical protein